MEAPKCDICGEQDVSCQTQECGMCDECFSEHCRDALRPLLGNVCASISRQENGWLQICLAVYGVEHVH